MKSAVKPQLNSLVKMASKLPIAFSRTFAVLLTLLLCLPVILLPFTTSVPTWGWVLLLAADGVLIALLFRFGLTSIGTLVHQLA